MSLRKDAPARVSPTADEPFPFRRVLVANRGEIAVRIIRACRELGLETVAVFSDADARAAHVRLADAAVRIGPPPPAESYLSIDAILAAAAATGADAIHPGYGFLAERAAFARAALAAGIVFVGPKPEAIEALGDKLRARRLASDAGVPIVPGTLEPAAIDRPEDLAPLIVEAESVGLPLLVKAASGGGGRGMRRVTRVQDLPVALVEGSREAMSAFGDGSVYLEREILPARHVEVQLLGDTSGEVIALGERDCSIQRRHQKLVEEAPAPGLSEEQRHMLHGLAVSIGTAAGLTNAATAEFLRSPDGSYHFLEVNTRLQVEHGVTELVTGVDIVQEQLRLAAGRPLSEAARLAGERPADGHAIEVRLSAEDPGRDFAPTPGLIRHWRMPVGEGIRVDTASAAGDRVPPEYDNLLAKIMVHAPDRDGAIGLLGDALEETEVAGIQTTLPFHRFVAEHSGFRAADVFTTWAAEQWDGRAAAEAAGSLARLAAALSVPPGAPGETEAHGRRPEPGEPSTDGSTPTWANAALQAMVDRWPAG